LGHYLGLHHVSLGLGEYLGTHLVRRRHSGAHLVRPQHGSTTTHPVRLHNIGDTTTHTVWQHIWGSANPVRLHIKSTTTHPIWLHIGDTTTHLIALKQTASLRLHHAPRSQRGTTTQLVALKHIVVCEAWVIDRHGLRATVVPTASRVDRHGLWPPKVVFKLPRVNVHRRMAAVPIRIVEDPGIAHVPDIGIGYFLATAIQQSYKPLAKVSPQSLCTGGGSSPTSIV
jgi:hypothetical protein